MSTLREIREKHYISRKKLAELSGVSESTIVRIETAANKTTEDVAKNVLGALGKQIKQELTLENVDGLNLYNVMRDRKQRTKPETGDTEESVA